MGWCDERQSHQDAEYNGGGGDSRWAVALRNQAENESVGINLVWDVTDSLICGDYLIDGRAGSG